MYDKKYAEAWIRNHESRKDNFRVEHFELFIKEIINKTPNCSKILDIGCGWGTVVEFLKDTHEYWGIDKTKEFLDYIKNKFPNNNLNLKIGFLPNKLPVPDEYFDLTICSMTLHCVKELKESIDNLFLKTKIKGKIILIDFNDSAEELIRNEIFIQKSEENDNHIKGIAILPSGEKIEAENYIHKEKDFEKIIKKHGDYTKRYLGPLFVIYEVVKKQ